MKIKILISVISILLCYAFTSIKENNFQDMGKRPNVYTDNFTKEVKDGAIINCRKIKDMGVVIYLNDEIKKLEVFKAELHRFGKDEDVLVAFKAFSPDSKEFRKMYSGKDSIQLKLLTEEGDWNTSDFEVNTLAFTSNLYVNNIFCTIHEIKHVDFYIVVKGYAKTGEKSRFGEDIYSGNEITPKSVVFKNWDFRK